MDKHPIQVGGGGGAKILNYYCVKFLHEKEKVDKHIKV